MANDLVEQGGKELAAPSSGADMLAMVVSAAKDETIDADKMKTLADLAIKLQDREAERRYRDAKMMAMRKMPSIGKKGEIRNRSGQVQSRFSRFEDLHRIVAPVLEEHNLSLDWRTGNEGPLILVEAILTYSDGELSYHEGGGMLPFPVDNQGGKSPVQGVASSLSMGKRHTMKAMLNIREHDESPNEDQSHVGQITEQQQVLIDEARMQAKDGMAAYRDWFASRNAQEKGFLVSQKPEDSEITYHDQNKAAAEQFGS